MRGIVILDEVKRVIREFGENEYYHVFNRGVEKRLIFLDEQDYNMFLYYIFIYLAEPKTVIAKYPTLPLRLRGKSLYHNVELLAYCLMPNHFHFLLRQKSKDGVSKFLKQFTNAYTHYFNTKYKRVGGLMQGRYKAARITSDEMLLHVSRYIHLYPLVASLVSDLANYKWSSYESYITGRKSPIVNTDIILARFPSKEAYKAFVLDQEGYGRELHKIEKAVLDLDD